MRALLLCALGALTLAACQQPAETPANDTTPLDATEAETAAGPSNGSNASGATGSSASGTAASTANGSAGTASMAADGAPPAGEGMMSGPSPATRDAAKERAEETNLHPRTP